MSFTRKYVTFKNETSHWFLFIYQNEVVTKPILNLEKSDLFSYSLRIIRQWFFAVFMGINGKTATKELCKLTGEFDMVTLIDCPDFFWVSGMLIK